MGTDLMGISKTLADQTAALQQQQTRFQQCQAQEQESFYKLMGSLWPESVEKQPKSSTNSIKQKRNGDNTLNVLNNT